MEQPRGRSPMYEWLVRFNDATYSLAKRILFGVGCILTFYFVVLPLYLLMWWLATL